MARGKGAYQPIAKKAPRKVPRKAFAPKRKPCRALMEIRKQQQSTDLCVPKAAFRRLVKGIMRDTGSPAQSITLDAVDALHAVSEAMITGLLFDANMVAVHSGRQTIMPKDIELIKALRSDSFGAQHGGRAGDISALGK